MDTTAEAIERLYRAGYLRFRNTLATITGSRESAHDAVQDAFARALRARRAFRGEGSLEAWIWRIAIRAALEHRADPRLVSLNGSLDPAPPHPERDPDLARALQALPPKRRLIVFLRYFADLSYREIAEVCGVSEGTVGATLAQARSALQHAIEKEEVRGRE